MTDKTKYSEKNIRSLKWDEAIRTRPEMYVGKVNSKGFIEMFKGILSSTLVNTSSDRVSLDLLGDLTAKLSFLNIKKPIKNNWNQWKPNPINPFVIEFQTLNALSEKFRISFTDSTNEKIEEQYFEKGKLISGKEIQEINCSNLFIEFTLDEKIWESDFVWNEMFINHEIREFAYLYKKVKFQIKYEVDDEKCKVLYHFKNGLRDRIDIEILKGLGNSYFETSIDDKIGDLQIEAAFAFREYSVDESYLKSYVNDFYTSENGSHVDGLLKGLTYGVMKYFQKHNLTDKYKISEKGVKENLTASINIKFETAVFSGCVKNKLANSEIIEPIANYISDLLFKKIEEDEDSTKKLIRKFEI